MRQSSRSPLDWGVLVCEGAGDASRCDSYGLWDRGGVAVMAHCNFSYRFSFGFGLMATCFHGRLQRDAPRGIAISARKLAQMRADF
jgi:hypothetical protein